MSEQTTRFDGTEIVASCATLTIRKCTGIPETLLPFHISVDAGEVVFEFPWAVCTRYGLAVNLAEAFAHLAKSQTCLPNRIRFHQLETYWFPFIAGVPSGTRNKVVSLLRGKLQFYPTVHTPLHTVVIDVTMSQAQREYVWVQEGAIALNESQWLDIEKKETLTACRVPPLPFVLKRSQVQHVDPIHGSSAHMLYDAFVASCETTPCSVLITVVDCDHACVMTIAYVSGRITVIGLDMTHERSQDAVDSFFTSYTQELIERYPSTRFAHTIHALPGICRDKTIQRMQRYGTDLRFVECTMHFTADAQKTISSSERVIVEHRLADVGYSIVHGKWTWIRPLIAVNAAREAYLIREFILGMQRMWCGRKESAYVSPWQRMFASVSVVEVVKGRRLKRARTLLA